MVDKKQVTGTTNKPGTVYVAGLPSYISAHHDNKGRMYFYNTITRVSAWDCNSLINQPTESKDLKFAVVNQAQAVNSTTKASNTNTVANAAVSAAKKAASAGKTEVSSPRKVASNTSMTGKKRSLEENDDNSSDGDNSQIEDAVKIGVLEKVFDHDRFPSKETREMLARELGMPVRRIETWFTRRRSRSREETTVMSPKKRQKNEVQPATSGRQTRLNASQAVAAQRSQQNVKGKAMSAKQAAAAAAKRTGSQTMAQKVAAAQKKAIANIQERPEVIVFELLQELSSHAHKQMGSAGQNKNTGRRFPSLEQLETCFTSCKPIQKIVSGEMNLDDSNPSSKRFMQFDFNKLSIDSYVRSAASSGDLKMKFNFSKHVLSIMVKNLDTKLSNKMEIDFNNVDGIAVDISRDQASVMTVQLTTPPRFLKEIAVGPSATTTWISCDDFTVGQASHCRRITFVIPKDTLRTPLEVLMKRDKRIKRLVGIGGEAFATNMYYSKSAKKANGNDIPDHLMDILSSAAPGDDPSAVEKLVWETPSPTDEQGLPFDTQLPSLDGENIFSVLATMNSGDEDSHSEIRGEGMLSPGEFLLEKEDISEWLGDDSNPVSGSSTPIQSGGDDSMMQDLLLPEEVSASV